MVFASKRASSLIMIEIIFSRLILSCRIPIKIWWIFWRLVYILMSEHVMFVSCWWELRIHEVISISYGIPPTGNFSLLISFLIFMRYSFACVDLHKSCGLYFTEHSRIFKCLDLLYVTTSFSIWSFNFVIHFTNQLTSVVFTCTFFMILACQFISAFGFYIILVNSTLCLSYFPMYDIRHLCCIYNSTRHDY